MTSQFSFLRTVVNELNSTNSINDKKDILARYAKDEFLQQVLYYTYNPFYQYYVTPANLEKRYYDDLGGTFDYNNLFSILEDLRTRKLTGHDAIQAVNNFAFKYVEFKDLIYKIIGKDLEIRMGDSLINKVIPNLIPTFDVALAVAYEDVEVDFESDEWYASRKLDGCRCLTVIDDAGNVSEWSRQGNQFETLARIEKAVKKLGLRDVVLDGEICLVDANGNEDFQGIMKQIRRKNHTIANPKYLIFDILTGAEFRAKKGNTKYSERYNKLCETIPEDNQYLSIVRQIPLNNLPQFSSMMLDADNKGWEGLILRKNVGYEGKRSKNMLKCKSFKDAEYVVKSIEVGPFRVIDAGLETSIEVMTNVLIEHKGNTVSVGSGFSIDERIEFMNDPSKIVGKVITVKYFTETQNQSGKYSLRFPTFKCLHGDKRTV